ncbi:hypothetical protein [Dickeya dianthicola]|uniref:hypothetical protein n=1 Tax=Dickeya dianthicola TaxID=204039 RepID=UPI0018664008|nr:hypothetical protein [Dickeya dianthicola]QOL15483.1 hypothetical protein HGI48_15525 [Dickeya dianthicola]
MTLKKRLINLLCLPIAISLVSINPGYAFTNEQYKTLIYGLAAGGAWAGWGTLNAVLAYIDRGGGPLTTADGANIFGTICGTNAAAYFRSWIPPTDPISAANILLAATKSGAVAASSITCHWASNAIFKLMFENAQTQASKMNTQNRRVLYHDANVLITLKTKLLEKIDIAASKQRAAENLAADYYHSCTDGQISYDCGGMYKAKNMASEQAKAANLVVRQTAWDVAHAAQQIAYDEHDSINSQHKMSPRPR